MLFNRIVRALILTSAAACFSCGADGGAPMGEDAPGLGDSSGSGDSSGTVDPTGGGGTTSTGGPSQTTGDPPEGAGDAAVGEDGPRAWRVLPSSPAGQYWNHDDVYFVDEDRGWVCDISGTIWRTTDGGDSWEKQLDQEGTSFRTLAFLDGQKGFVGTLGPGGWVDQTQDDTLMYGTSDGGEHWTKVTNIQGADALRGICGMVTVDDKTIYGVGRYDGPAGFIKTTDGGATWVAKKVAEADGLVDLHFFDAKTGLLGGRRGGGSVILRTTDGGETFTTVAKSSSDHIWKIFFLDDKTGYAMISNYSLFATRFYLKTEDAGLTWSEVHYTPPVNDYEGLGVGFVSKELGWAAGGAVTYETRDGGKTFTPINLDPEGGDTINRFFRVGDTMYAAGARIYKYDLVKNASGAAAKSASTAPSSALALTPDPFRKSGKLSYTVSEPGPVSIGVVSIGGRLIESLVAQTKPAGSYELDYRPEYSQKFVRITLLAGDQRKSMSVVRAGGGEYPKYEDGVVIPQAPRGSP